MPFSSGTFSRIYNWVNEQLSSPIEIAKLDEQEQDFATGLSNCILRDGTGLPTAAQDWNGQNLTNVAAFTATGIVTGGRFVPTSSSAPTNGMYLSAANTLAFASNSTLRWSVNSNGAHVFAAATSGSTLRTPDAYIGLLGGTNNPRVEIEATEANGNVEIDFTASVATGTASIKRFNTSVIDISANRNVTIGAPSSGTTLAIASIAGADAISATAAGQVTARFTNTSNSVAGFVGADTTGAFFGASTAHPTFLYAGGSSRVTIGAAGNVAIAAPSSGTTLAVSAVSGGTAATFTDGNYTAKISGGVGRLDFGAQSSSILALTTADTRRVEIGTAGNVTINAPSSGATLIATVGASLVGQRWTDGTRTLEVQQDSSANYFGTPGAQELRFFTNSLSRITIGSNGAVTVVAPTSGVGLTVAGGGASITGGLSVSGGVTASFTGDGSAITALNATQLTSGTVPTARITSVAASCTIDGVTVGFRSVPRSTTTTTAATTDVGKCIAASAGITIPNATFAAGDCLSIYNDSASSITITQGASLTLRLAGTTTTGNLTLQPRGMATVWFNTASEAIASGSGLG